MKTMNLHRDQKCGVCCQVLVKPTETSLVRSVNKCGHVFHEACLSKKAKETLERGVTTCPMKDCKEKIKCQIRGDKIIYGKNQVHKFTAKCDGAPPVEVKGNPKFVTRTTFAIVALAICFFCTTWFSFLVASAVLITAISLENRFIQFFNWIDTLNFGAANNAHGAGNNAQ